MTTRQKTKTLAAWIEDNITLPDVVAVPGPLILAPYMREIADAIGDPAIERVSVLKSTRIGFSCLCCGCGGGWRVFGWKTSRVRPPGSGASAAHARAVSGIAKLLKGPPQSASTPVRLLP